MMNEFWFVESGSLPVLAACEAVHPAQRILMWNGTTNLECLVTGISTTHDNIEIEAFEILFFSSERMLRCSEKISEAPD
jgi:hypothetical protein